MEVGSGPVAGRYLELFAGDAAQMFIGMQRTEVLAVASKVTDDVKYANRAR